MITANTVKELREKTNAGMMDCKKALEETQGDMEKAIEVLRKKGLALAKKKEGREVKEGVLGSFCEGKGRLAGFVEVNCETDFVVNTPDFQNFVSQVTKIVCQKGPNDCEALLKLSYDSKQTVGEALTALVAKIGENIQVRRLVRWETQAKDQCIGSYLHAGSKIGVLVWMADSQKPIDPLIVKEAAMHVAAMNPRYLHPEEIPEALLEKEREILGATIDSKKPREIQARIIEGKLKKFYSEECLVEQIFVKDPEGKKTVRDWLKGVSPTARIEKFVRLQVGT